MNKRYRKKEYKKRTTVSAEPVVRDGQPVEIPAVITVKELSEKTGIPVVSLISELMKSGILAAINESIDFDTAAIVCDDQGVKCVLKSDEGVDEEKTISDTANSKNLTERPPVVTIMGHVDHGKTSLLDKIRLADVAGSESGGITQHISAYQVEMKGSNKKDQKNRIITFIDTPGHAAFSALRGHGAAITDIVVLIVAADDGVMPQTVEVIDQAKKHNVPVIVAINKVDLPDADVMKVKQQLSDHGLLPEEWGGKTVMVEVSAKTGQGVENLLEVILLQAEMMELRADANERAFGVVIESHMHKGAGPLAVVLVENGTLHRGDTVQVGSTWGKVRILEDYNSKAIEAAGPSAPVRIAGLKEIPSFGDHLMAFDSEKEAKNASYKNANRDSVRIATARKMQAEEGGTAQADLEYRIIIKADVKGSLEAIKQLLSEIDTQELSIKIVGQGIGAVSESDVTLAKAAKAHVYAFRVPVLVSAKKISEKEKVAVNSYDVIYEMIDDIKATLTSMLPAVFVEETLGRGKVLAIFRNDKKAMVVGAKLDDGKISTADLIKFISDNDKLATSKIVSLRREKDEVNEVASGVEFGLSLEPGTLAEVDQKFEIYRSVEQSRKIA